MASGVSGRSIAFLATDGVDQRELVEPWHVLADAGADVRLISVHSGEVRGAQGDGVRDGFPVDRTLREVRAGEYDGLVLPGGLLNADRLRTNAEVVSFVRAFMDSDKPVAALGHAPWLLVEADAVRGRTVTSWPSLRTDIRNAGGEWVDQPVVTDQKLVTSRGKDDLSSFCAKFLTLFGRAIDERRLDFMVEQSFPASDPLPGPSAGPASRHDTGGDAAADGSRT